MPQAAVSGNDLPLTVNIDIAVFRSHGSHGHALSDIYIEAVGKVSLHHRRFNAKILQKVLRHLSSFQVKERLSSVNPGNVGNVLFCEVNRPLHIQLL